MLKKLTTAFAMVLMVSSFALAGQAPTAPNEQPRVTQRNQTNKTSGAKNHHKHHKKHHTTASKK